MSYRLQKAVVLGSGVMGSGIACHLANIGMEVLMLDIVPFDISDADKNNPKVRNSIVDGALKAALKSKPAALYSKDFCGTHFFNPPRYLRLLEVIPHATTDQSVVDFFMEFGDRNLGKQTVLCKDTPAFIGNRIGIVSGNKIALLTDKYDMKIEEVDSITGPLIGRPNTASYRLNDLVGLDTGEKVTKFLYSAVDDEFVSKVKDLPTPKYMDFLLENKYFGNKSGQGFYQKTKKRDENGKRIINALNLKTLEYEPAIKRIIMSTLSLIRRYLVLTNSSYSMRSGLILQYLRIVNVQSTISVTEYSV